MVEGQTGSFGTALASAAPSRLSAERCRCLLSGAIAGYLALSQGALPTVVPVSCALDGDGLLVRAGPDLVGRVPLQPGIVAFGTTMTSLDESSRWEVLVRGRAEVEPGARNREIPPPLSHVDAGSTTVLRISLELLTGWQYDSSLGRRRSS
ncbi:MAG TPA: hypothetical protein VEJ84_09705 [Acidimicrobiales bacterium]|nr:hypothetical protein [Acidimicrobiales bacterium]